MRIHSLTHGISSPLSQKSKSVSNDKEANNNLVSCVSEVSELLKLQNENSYWHVCYLRFCLR
ncbi:hypothetical protein RchiOBHm_Chr6g0253611 [Rosa chinensis]|uniref:Uncharacterized protein n=1 Tax=Rosa chinensis TaxID=74649 RepID=A0A2P6PLD8_ROSCH|nr:hypothetical protein RchiOBHm_Chr6g0253611 [Rosa chinensis]